MKAHDIFHLLKERAPGLAREIMRSDFTLAEPPIRSELVKGYFAFQYEMNGDFVGDIVLFVDKDETHGVVKEFLLATFGENMELPGGVEGVCQEIANIFIGRYTGLIFEKGYSVQIVGPGKTHQPGEVIKQLPTFGDGSGNLFAISPFDGERAGSMTFWAEFRESANK